MGTSAENERCHESVDACVVKLYDLREDPIPTMTYGETLRVGAIINLRGLALFCCFLVDESDCREVKKKSRCGYFGVAQSPKWLFSGTEVW
jgi:hypothetical protein